MSADRRTASDAAPLHADRGAPAGVVVAASPVEPLRAHREALDLGLDRLVRRPGGQLLVGLVAWLVPGRALAPGGADDRRAWPGLERARPRPALRRRRALRRAHLSSAPRSTGYWTGWRRMSAPRAAAYSAELSHELRTPVAAIAVGRRTSRCGASGRRPRIVRRWRGRPNRRAHRDPRVPAHRRAPGDDSRPSTWPDLAAAVASAAASLRPTASTCGVHTFENPGCRVPRSPGALRARGDAPTARAPARERLRLRSRPGRGQRRSG